MRKWVTGGRIGVLGSVLLLGVPLSSESARAAESNHSRGHSAARATAPHASAISDRHAPLSARGSELDASRLSFGGRSLVLLASTSFITGHGGGMKQAVFWTRKGHKGAMRYVTGGARSGGGGISCVPYAREVSGIELTGNAATWWDEAAGLYARGNAPEPGSVLNFRANSSMRLGHVAVVSAVVSGREIEIEHANWWGPGASKGGISRNISVVDVSPNNDWTAVRVGLGLTRENGSIYPTYGFIYARRDDGSTTRVAAAAPIPSLNPAPRDLRPARERSRSYDEVAEVPAGRPIDLSIGGFDAPDRRFK